MYRGRQFLPSGKTQRLLSGVLSVKMKVVWKWLKRNLESHCNGTKTLPVDAEFHSLLDHMSCIERIDFWNWKNKQKPLSCLLSIMTKSVLKSINTNLQSHCNRTKSLPVDAEFNSPSNYMSYIEGSDFCHWKKTEKLLSCVLCIIMKPVLKRKES